MGKTSEVNEEILESFKKENKKAGIRVFVAGGSRSGNEEQYAKEAYILGRKILNFGYS